MEGIDAQGIIPGYHDLNIINRMAENLRFNTALQILGVTEDEDQEFRYCTLSS
jgi:hypothetical protein